MCSSALITKTVEEAVEFFPEDLQEALSEYVKDEEDTLRDAFDSALKIEKVEPTLRVLVAQDQTGAHIDDLYRWAKTNGVRVAKKKLKEDLELLEKDEFGELIKLEENSQKYSFIDPFYCSFAMAYFEQKDGRTKNRRMTDKELVELLNNTMSVVRSHYKTEELDVIGHNDL
tara:strand:+ start:80 stop:595 length:516 start_codon:yes stop_codon:yes gene_type:complete